MIFLLENFFLNILYENEGNTIQTRQSSGNFFKNFHYEFSILLNNLFIQRTTLGKREGDFKVVGDVKKQKLLWDIAQASAGQTQVFFSPQHLTGSDGSFESFITSFVKRQLLNYQLSPSRKNGQEIKLIYRNIGKGMPAPVTLPELLHTTRCHLPASLQIDKQSSS